MLAFPLLFSVSFLLFVWLFGCLFVCFGVVVLFLFCLFCLLVVVVVCCCFGGGASSRKSQMYKRNNITETQYRSRIMRMHV